MTNCKNPSVYIQGTSKGIPGSAGQLRASLTATDQESTHKFEWYVGGTGDDLFDSYYKVGLGPTYDFTYPPDGESVEVGVFFEYNQPECSDRFGTNTFTIKGDVNASAPEPREDPDPDPDQDPDPEEPILVTEAYSHRVVWEVTWGGRPINVVQPGAEEDDEEEGETGAGDDDDDEMPELYPSYAELPEVDITPEFDYKEKKDLCKYVKTNDPYVIPQPKLVVRGKVQKILVRESEFESGDVEIELISAEDVPYTLESLTLTSVHSGRPADLLNSSDGGVPGNPQWVYPDDFPGASVPEGTPKEFGGIVLRDASPVPDDKRAGEYSTCSSDGKSGYQYLDVFYRFDFKYHPRNSIRFDTTDEYIHVDVKNSRDRFPTVPRFPCIKDEENKKAPIMPMDVITTYLPDISEYYIITYQARLKATIDLSLGEDLLPVAGIINPILTMTQVVTQDIEQFADQLTNLLSIANFNFLGTYGGTFNDMAPGYPYAYPYTVVSGYDGQDAEEVPTRRNTVQNVQEGPLQKGDIWYNEYTEERKYYQINSFVESVKIVNPGSIYQGPPKPMDMGKMIKQNAEIMKGLDNIGLNVDKYLEGDAAAALAGIKGTSFTFEEAATKSREEPTRKYIPNLTTYPIKYNVDKPNTMIDGFYEMDLDTGAYGLLVDIEANDSGQVVSAKVVNGGIGYTNVTHVAILGGDCILEISVNKDEFWTDEYVDRLDLPREDAQFMTA